MGSWEGISSLLSNEDLTIRQALPLKSRLMPGGVAGSTDMSLNKLQEMVKERELVCCSTWDLKELDTTV